MDINICVVSYLLECTLIYIEMCDVTVTYYAITIISLLIKLRHIINFFMATRDIYIIIYINLTVDGLSFGSRKHDHIRVKCSKTNSGFAGHESRCLH